VCVYYRSACVRVCIEVHVCVYVSECMCMCMYRSACVCVFIGVHVCVYVWECMCIYVCECVLLTYLSCI